MGQAADGDFFFHPNSPDYPLTSFLSERLGLKEIFRPAGMEIVSPVLGFRPGRALRAFTLKVPSPVNEIFPPDRTVSRMALTNDFVAFTAWARVTPASFATRWTNSNLFMGPPQDPTGKIASIFR
jgi:hypothetical protein